MIGHDLDADVLKGKGSQRHGAGRYVKGHGFLRLANRRPSIQAAVRKAEPV